MIARLALASAPALMAALALALDALFPPPLARPGGDGAIIEDRNGAPLYAFAAPDGRRRLPADLDAIDPTFVSRLIAIEDKRFRRHGGVDPGAIVRAAASNVRARRIVSGASTITMQTARLLEPRPRTPGAKLIEAFRAWQLERRLTKDAVLERYLTLAPYGGALEGVRAASLAYFGKEPARLSDAEQALLIALPQAPEARRPDRRPDAARAARMRILSRLRALGFIDEDRAAAAAQAPIPQEVRAFPDRAYHAAYAEFIRRSRGAAPRRLTLDAGMQAAAERVAARYAAQADDGANVSVLIVESATRAVRAHVGAAARAQPGGWIDLTRAVRSPGSTLKPLIYALAFDSGLARADTILIDAPRPFGDYAPANFDGAFRGAVPLADALRHSLNVPAVATLDRVGAARLENTLTASGLPVRRADRDAPGLALALGGAGLRAVDLATLYAALADDGVVAPLRPRVGEARDAARACNGPRINSPVAARAQAELRG
ncbi:MAG: transglycosylase domain-containing protein, partial [Pseudomonadota bacterium]